MIIASAITRGRGTFCYSLLRRRDRRAGCHRSSVASASAVSLSITTGGPHELLDHIGVTSATSSTQPGLLLWRWVRSVKQGEHALGGIAVRQRVHAMKDTFQGGEHR